MKGKPTETADLSSCKLIYTRLIAREYAWDLTRLACGQQLYSLVCLRSPCHWDQDLSLVHELVFLEPIPYGGWDALLSFDAEGRSLILTQLDMQGLVDSP